MSQSDSSCIGHEPCPACGSRDNLARYDDGHGWCFGCNYYDRGDGTIDTTATTTTPAPSPTFDRIVGEYRALQARGLSKAACEKYRYQCDDARGAQIADFYDANGRLCAQKLRFRDKTFSWRGDHKAAALFGQQLWGAKGKRVVVTEGEIDAISLGQVFGLSWPVVSVQNGVGTAAQKLTAQLEWLEGYDEIVLAFDADEKGQAAAQECAEIFTPGKVKLVIAYPGGAKDANEALVKGHGDDLRKAVMFEAKPWRPDGIVSGVDLIDRLLAPPPPSVPYPWNGLNQLLRGMRRGEVTTFCAGTGVGKSQVMREITYHLRSQGEKVGVVALEESVVKAASSQVALYMGKRLHDPQVRAAIDPVEIADAAKVALDGVYFYEHTGVRDTSSILSRIRYMARGLGCGHIILDHISIMISGNATDGDERKRIDELMTKLGSLAEELGIHILLVSHLRKADGTPHEEGGRVTMDDLRGSAAIKQVSYNIVALERDQQATDPVERNTTTLRVLKCREFGETGLAGLLVYSPETGRITEGAAMAPVTEPGADEGDF